MKREVIGEVTDILRIMPIEQLKYFAKLRNDKDWPVLGKFVGDQKQIQLDKIYRLKRPHGQDDVIHNAVDHEYYASRISSLVLLLQIIENASDEIERRERREK